MQEYIDLRWHTVPLTGKLERLEDGSKTIPKFEKNWRSKYQEEFNTKATPLGGAITGEISNIIAIDCDNPVTWQLFRSLDPDYEFVFMSKGKYDEPTGTLIYEYTHELSDTFSINNGDLALDFYSNRGFIYLATEANKTKETLVGSLPDIKPVPPTIRHILKQFHESILAPKESKGNDEHTNIITASCLAPLVEQFCLNKEFMPGLFKIITPKDFRTITEYVDKGYLHPANVPDGRGSEYLAKVSAILGADISINEELYIKAMHAINDLFAHRLETSRFEKTILDPMVDKKASANGKVIWQYDENWSKYRLILKGKRQTNFELAFDDNRNMYYVVDVVNNKIKSFHRDSELMAYLEAAVIESPKKLELKRSLPIVNVAAAPNKPFGFNEDDDPTARLLNTFVQTPELLVFNNPDVYVEKYKRPSTTLKYLETLVPDDQMREYLLRFVTTKLLTFKYSPVILYFLGAHGSGKDLFVGLLETIIGHVSRPTTKEFLELFNGWMLDSYFVQLDEYGNQLTNVREKEEALGKIKAYTGKQNIQVRQMRTDGFTYKHNVTFIMTANRNPLMLEEGDRRIAFFETPKVLADQDWVLDAGGVAEVYLKIQSEIKDFCYYLATEVQPLSSSEYVKPPESGNKHELIASSMYAAQRIAYALKHGMKKHLVKLAESYELDHVAERIRMADVTTEELNDLYDEMTDHNGNHRNFFKILKENGIELKQTTRNNQKTYSVKLQNDTPFVNHED